MDTELIEKLVEKINTDISGVSIVFSNNMFEDPEFFDNSRTFFTLEIRFDGEYDFEELNDVFENEYTVDQEENGSYVATINVDELEAIVGILKVIMIFDKVSSYVLGKYYTELYNIK